MTGSSFFFTSSTISSNLHLDFGKISREGLVFSKRLLMFWIFSKYVPPMSALALTASEMADRLKSGKTRSEFVLYILQDHQNTNGRTRKIIILLF